MFDAGFSRDISSCCEACAARMSNCPKSDIAWQKYSLYSAKTGLYQHHQSTERKTLHTQGQTPMLFIFSKPNFVQIAWNSKVPDSQSRVRNTVMSAPFGPLGFIRTRSVG
ncbi:hypothetical protein [Pararhizobium sp. DWP1-1-3]|uniref:hypothetical protein n=1 Tax=Pararhizobium sp. DWP1-1-3 TaxID=2804652 RepID=UPI003CED4C5D